MKYILLISLLFSISTYSQVATSSYSGPGGGAVSTLYDNLIAAWGLNEASGPDVYDYTTTYDGTAQNTPTFAQTGKVNDAISFASGSSEYIDFGTSFWDPGTSDMTVAGWVQFSTTSLNGGIVGNWGTPPYWYVRMHGDDRLYAVVNFNTPDANLETISNSALTIDTWYHFIYELDRSGNASLYLNNVLQTDIDDISGKAADNIANANNHQIGSIGNNPGGYYMDGILDAIQVWSRILTSDERAENYNSGNGWEP